MQAAGAAKAGSAQLGPGLGLPPAGRGTPRATDLAAQQEDSEELKRFLTAAPEQLEPEPEPEREQYLDSDSDLDSDGLVRFSTAREKPVPETPPEEPQTESEPVSESEPEPAEPELAAGSRLVRTRSPRVPKQLCTGVSLDAVEKLLAHADAWKVAPRVLLRDGRAGIVLADGSDFARGDGCKDLDALFGKATDIQVRAVDSSSNKVTRAKHRCGTADFVDAVLIKAAPGERVRLLCAGPALRKGDLPIIGHWINQLGRADRAGAPGGIRIVGFSFAESTAKVAAAGKLHCASYSYVLSHESVLKSGWRTQTMNATYDSNGAGGFEARASITDDTWIKLVGTLDDSAHTLVVSQYTYDRTSDHDSDDSDSADDGEAAQLDAAICTSTIVETFGRFVGRLDDVEERLASICRATEVAASDDEGPYRLSFPKRLRQRGLSVFDASHRGVVVRVADTPDGVRYTVAFTSRQFEPECNHAFWDIDRGSSLVLRECDFERENSFTTKDCTEEIIMWMSRAGGMANQSSEGVAMMSCVDPTAIGEPTAFVSHAWRTPFVDLVNALRDKAQPGQYYWLDIFVINQHGTDSLPDDFWTVTFMDMIKRIGTALLVLEPWDSPIALSRAWCLWEVFSAIKTGSEIHVILTEEGWKSFFANMWHRPMIDVKSSTCTSTFDTAKIMSEISGSGLTCAEIDGIVAARLCESSWNRASFDDIEELRLGTIDLRDEGAASVVHALAGNTSVRLLGLWKCHIGPAGAGHLARLLSSNRQISKLDLGRNSFGDEGATALATGLRDNYGVVKQIYLGFCEIGDVGCVALAAGLGASKCDLELLALHGNAIGDVGATALGDALRDSTTLETCLMAKNHITDQGAIALVTALDACAVLKKLALGENEIMDACQQQLIESSKRTACWLDFAAGWH
jgi:hypothetical protein